MIKKIFCFMLCVIILITPTFASNYDSSFSYNSLYFMNVFSSTTNNVFGYASVVSSDDFLVLALSALQSNIEFMQFANVQPYSVQRVIVNGLDEYLCVTSLKLNFRSITANSGNIYINGHAYDASITNTFPNDANELVFPRATYFTQNGNGISKTLYVAEDYNDQIILANVGTDPYLNSVITKLTSIVNSCQSITTVCTNINSKINNLFTAVSNISSDLQTVNSYLSTIDSNLSDISTTVDSILSANNTTNNLINDLQDYFEIHFPILETDLNTINTSINNFRVQFGNFAIDCLAALNRIDATTQSIDETLDAIMDYYNGTALESVPVTTSGGSSINLWSLIKNSVTTTLSGVSGFFNGLFDFIGIFSTSASGFNTFLTISTWAPVNYVPEDLTLSNHNIIPDESFNYWDPSYRFHIVRSGTTITVTGPDHYNGGYSRQIQTNITLEPGDYLLYAPNSNGSFSIILRIGTSNFGSYVSDGNYPFRVNNTTTFNILLSIPANQDGFTKSFDLKVVRTG